MIARLAVTVAGAAVLAVGLGWAWAMYFPSSKSNNILFGGMLIPIAWIAAALWLWFASWRQRWLRLAPAAIVLWSAIAWGLHG